MEADLAQYARRAEDAELEIQKLVKELEVVEKETANRGTKSAIGEKSIKLDSNKGDKGKIYIDRNV
jgi:hypothetical protein